jgi:hypothetical protein
VIVREIEQTRAELAETIDAITDRLSPRRAATRSVQVVKEQVTEEGPRPKVLAAAGAAAVVAGVVVARKRR